MCIRGLRHRHAPAGEAKRKHVFMLETRADDRGQPQWRIVKQALTAVRPFVYEAIALKDQPGLSPDKPDAISAVLEAKVC